MVCAVGPNSFFQPASSPHQVNYLRPKFHWVRRPMLTYGRPPSPRINVRFLQSPSKRARRPQNLVSAAQFPVLAFLCLKAFAFGHSHSTALTTIALIPLSPSLRCMDRAADLPSIDSIDAHQDSTRRDDLAARALYVPKLQQEICSTCSGLRSLRNQRLHQIRLAQDAACAALPVNIASGLIDIVFHRRSSRF